MCGIVGWAFDTSLADRSELIEVATDTLVNRGPDGRGTWTSRSGEVVFGHRRLSLLDISETGSQPMFSECKRFVITYNGEIYNHLEIREQLAQDGGQPSQGWRGTSDTETLLAALKAWGVDRTLKAAYGMFAFALWDEEKDELTLARDRLGEKPLYVSRVGKGLAFASELKAVENLPGFDKTINDGALADYLRKGYLSAPSTIYMATCKLLPGTYVSVTKHQARGLASQGDFLAPFRRPYWEALEVAKRGIANPFQGSDEEAVDALQEVLARSVGRQKIADVPVGAFLSGGIDSTAVVALMQAGAMERIKTFTISFDDPEFDESPHAERVARHLGTDHTTVPLSMADALERVPLLPTIWDEPFADPSQLPTLLVSEVARRNVTASLSGDGGDELFGGYSRYHWTKAAWAKLRGYPLVVRRVAAGCMTALPTSTWDNMAKLLGQRVSGERMHKVASLIAAGNVGDLYATTLSAWRGNEQLLLNTDESPSLHWSGYPDLGELVHTLRYRDSVDYMPDDVLVKVERASMSVSLETRAPFLDPDVVAFAWSLPLEKLVRNGKGKWALRKLVHRYVPEELVERPKAGFSVPIHTWLRADLRAWAEGLLTQEKLTASGLNTGPVLGAWQAHLSGAQDHRHFLWNVLSYLAWRDSRRI